MAQQQSSSGIMAGAMTVLGLGLVWLTVAASFPSQEELFSALNNVTPGRFPRVLVVDDTPEARRLIRRILQSQGDFEIFEATNGREAVQLANLEHPDLIILDLMMPEVDGFAALDELRSKPQTANIPVIVAYPRRSGCSFPEKPTWLDSGCIRGLLHNRRCLESDGNA